MITVGLIAVGSAARVSPSRPLAPPIPLGAWGLQNEAVQAPEVNPPGLPITTPDPRAYTTGTDFRPGPRLHLDEVVHVDHW